jgi:hypothetical protein
VSLRRAHRRPASRWRRALALGAVALVAALASGLTLSPPPALAARRAPVPRHLSGRAPSGPPLGAPAPGEEEQTAGIPSAAGDQLVENGLASPLCRGANAASLSAAAQRNCRTSGFIGAPAPINDYAIDVHIDTGTFGVSKGGLLSVIQDIFIAPVWGALEWVVHALVVMLEWCYTLELLDGSTTSTVASALGRARAGFTDPWLVLVLALASMLALYHGLVRRRVAETLGGAAAMLAMMAGGLWVIADPSGTVGLAGRWADQASLGTLAATVSGTPASASATLGDGMRSLYRATIETPWCYMEFGNVGWCAYPARLEGHLRAAALALVSHGAHSAASAQAAELVRSAGTNGALFLAFPANGPERNSINDESSLLSAICQSKDATKCNGPAASEAQFRTDGGTFPRVLGLLAIAVGVLGMALLFGALALRLLAAAFLALFLLLLAPFAVLAPALGDGGRAVFAGWATRLLGAVVSKLLFSFVLGALLTMQRILVSLAVLGWWTQWLLLTAFWWTVFLKRHQAAAILQSAGRAGAGGRERGGGGAHSAGGGGRGGPEPAGGGRWPLVGRVERTLQAYGAVRHPRRWAQAQVNKRIAPAKPSAEERPHRRRQRKAFPFKGRGRARGRVVDRAEGETSGAATLGGTAPGGVAPEGTAPEATATAPEATAAAPEAAAPEAAAPGAPAGGDGDVLARLLEQRPRGDDVRSPVMEDAFAVAQRRKRQLGFDSTPEQ